MGAQPENAERPKKSLLAWASALGQSRPGRAINKSDDVRYALIATKFRIPPK